MKVATLIIRILLGAMFVWGGINGLFELTEMPPMDENAQTFIDGLVEAGYFFPFLKITELLLGIILLSGRFTALAAVMLVPITLNIFLFHAFLDPDTVIISALLFLMNCFLIYVNRQKFDALLRRK